MFVDCQCEGSMPDDKRKSGGSRELPKNDRVLSHTGRSRSQARPDFRQISLGHCELLGENITVDEQRRLRHSHIVGTTGSGKTNALAYLMKQDINRGRGIMLIDPHGGDPTSPLTSDSLYSTILAHCNRMHLVERGMVHVIDPARRTHSAGFNPLAPLEGFEPDVLADMMLQCVEKVWKEDTHQKPATRSVLRATFIALVELKLTLKEATILLDRTDAGGLRRYAISKLESDYARDVLSRLQELSLDRNKSQFDMRVEGPYNRIDEFISNASVKNMLAQTRHLLDLVSIMDKGHVLLANLQPTTKAEVPAMRVIGTMLLRYLLALAPQRTNRMPFFVYIDECQNYLTGDIPPMLEEIRKRSVGIHLAHQLMGQLRRAGDDIFDAVTGCTEVKMVFRMKNAVEAREIVDCFAPEIDYEKPIRVLTKPTVIGNEIIWLENDSKSVNNSQAKGITTTDTETNGTTVIDSETEAETTGTVDMATRGSQEGSFSGEAAASVASETISQTIIPDMSMFGSGLPSTIGTLTPNTSQLSGARSTANSSGLSSGKMHGTNEGTAHGNTHNLTYARGHAVANMQSFSRALSHSLQNTHGEGTTRGRAQALSPIYKDLPTAVYSRDDIIDMLARSMLRFADGEAYVSAGGRTGIVKVPFLPPPKLSREDLSTLVTLALERSPFATNVQDVQKGHAERLADLRREIHEQPDALFETDDWSERYTDPAAAQDVVDRASGDKPKASKPTLVVDNDKPDDEPEKPKT